MADKPFQGHNQPPPLKGPSLCPPLCTSRVLPSLFVASRAHSCPWKPNDSSCRRMPSLWTPCWQCCAPSLQLHLSSSGGCKVPPGLWDSPLRGTARHPPGYQSLWTHPNSTDWWERVVLGEWGEERWLRNFCMLRQTFEEICHWLTPALRHHDTCMQPALTVEKRVTVAIWKQATPDSYRSVGQQFGVGKATVGAVLMEVVRAINAMLLHGVIHLGDVDNTIASFQDLGFLNCIGALDGTNIPIRAPPHINFGTWNIRSLMDNSDSEQLERCTAVIACKLRRFNINIAALAEMCRPEGEQLREEDRW
ncbi:uncharacterized protein LOC142021846 [Carettochelys insculpta]|uniref:uncharacterized protein LOC142021846 n=1 Tax=Carettochelys insculpta TaxID=44489 RepID=UPI003EBEAE71